MGTYICTAENGVPPSMARRTQLYVHFPPMLWIPNQLIGVPQVAALSWSVWWSPFQSPSTTGRGTTANCSSLAIATQSPNSLGSTEGAIRVYETVNPHSTSTAKTDYVEDERLEMLDDSLSRERNFPNQSPAHEPASTQDTKRSDGTNGSPPLILTPLLLYVLFLL
ncbi:lachesin [Caerostris extrusa]|uniref:Lachesin n=1 Tax=Caerostris extrusa TaxID=172846 RepID=A0AAV4SDI6_CAEEX|nr:lachesin [Caerostris extrusa]